MVLRGMAALRGQADLHAALAGARVVLALCTLGVLAGTVYMESRRFALARTEQALLALTPAAPAAAQMNRVLARLLMAGFGGCWAILALATLAALLILGAQPGELARVGAVWAMALPLVAVPLRDFARNEGPPEWPWALVLAMLAGCAALACGGAGRSQVWWAVGAGGVLAGAALAYWRWRVMLAAAPAFPAGRGGV